MVPAMTRKNACFKPILALLAFAGLFAAVQLTAAEADLKDGLYAEIKTTKGDIILSLEFEKTPLTVCNFVALAEGKMNTTARKGQRFYDGLNFHRVIPGFVIQGGCPKGDGTGGPGWTVDAEFNDRPHEPGVLSAARSADPNSAGSQFFVCLTRENCQHLDNQYTAFGKVVDGMDVVDAIAAVPTGNQGGHADVPVDPVTINSVTVSD